MKKLKQKSEIKNPQELYDPFKDKDYLDYKDEAERKWGNISAYKQSMERVKKMTKQDMEKLKSTNEILTKKLAKSMDSNIKSKQVQDLIEEHYKGICFFYDCSLDMYRNLATMYVEDPRFTAYYEKFRLGLAQFMKQAIEYYCDVQQQKN